MRSVLNNRIAAATIFVIVAAVIVYLGVNDPEKSLVPRCLFNVMTGYDCPGCGSQRAIHALLHGRIGDAWRYNAALFFAVPLAAIYFLAPRRWNRVLYSPIFISGIFVALVAWWILRNVI